MLSLGQRACWINICSLNWTGGMISLQFWLFSACANVMDDPDTRFMCPCCLPGCDHQPIFSCKPTFFLFWEVIKITILPSLSNSQSDFSLLLSNSFHFSFKVLPKTLAFAGLTYLIRLTNADDFYRELSLICFETFIYSIWHVKWLNYFWFWNEVAWTRFEFSKKKKKKKTLKNATKSPGVILF